MLASLLLALLAAAPEAPPAPPVPADAGALAQPASPRTDFSGTWKLDLAASDSLDELLSAQGASWVERKLAGSVVVTQKVAHLPAGLEVCVESSVKNACSTTRVGAGWESKKVEKGEGRARTDWSPDGKALITLTELRLEDGTTIDVKLTRTLEAEGKTTVQTIELKKAGKSYRARRVLQKQ